MPKPGIKNLSERLYHMTLMIIKIVGSLIFLYLCKAAAGRFTYYILPGGPEYPQIEVTSIFSNLAALAAAVIVYFLLRKAEQHFNESVKHRITLISLIISLLWMGAAVYWWISAADRIPVGDQAYLYGAASYFQEGLYVFLDPGGYCGFFPYQLSVIAMYEFLFLFVGTYNYLAIEIVSGILAVLIVFTGHRLLSDLTDSMASLVLYDLLMMGCLPLIFYTSWVYGDIPGLFFILLAARLLIRYDKTGKIRYLTGMAVSAAMSVLFRNHSYILIIALVLAALFHLIGKKDPKVLIFAILSFLLIQIAYQSVFKMYEIRSGIPHAKGFTWHATVAMGFQQTPGNYVYNGWYNNYVKEAYIEADFDKEKVTELAKENIRERLAVFRADPAYARIFFREKILSQWDMPLYQSLFYNAKYPLGTPPAAGSLADRVADANYMDVLHFSIKWQLIIYAGMLLYYLLGVQRCGNILHQVISMTVIGGFLFSIIWEAQARYVFPYYVLMFPYAVLGYEHLAGRLSGLISDLKQKRDRIPAV